MNQYSYPSPTIDTEWTRLTRRIKKLLLAIVVVIAIIGGLVAYWQYSYTYSEGYRAGLLQKFSHKGYIVKTYEGEMVLSSVISNANTPLASEKFHFSVTNITLAQKLDTMQGSMVMVHYVQKNRALFWYGDSPYLVDSIKRVK